jgi:hypothetical protein
VIEFRLRPDCAVAGPAIAAEQLATEAVRKVKDTAADMRRFLTDPDYCREMREKRQQERTRKRNRWNRTGSEAGNRTDAKPGKWRPPRQEPERKPTDRRCPGPAPSVKTIFDELRQWSL